MRPCDAPGLCHWQMRVRVPRCCGGVWWLTRTSFYLVNIETNRKTPPRIYEGYVWSRGRKMYQLFVTKIVRNGSPFTEVLFCTHLGNIPRCHQIVQCFTILVMGIELINLKLWKIKTQFVKNSQGLKSANCTKTYWVVVWTSREPRPYINRALTRWAFALKNEVVSLWLQKGHDACCSRPTRTYIFYYY